MISFLLPVIIVAAAAVAGCASADPDRPTAADSTTGVWGGTIEHDGQSMAISYAVRLQKGRSRAQIVLPAHDGHEQQQIQMQNLTWDETTLGFSWTPPGQEEVNCALVKQSDTLLSGNCWDANSQRVMDMTMTPPPGRLERL